MEKIKALSNEEYQKLENDLRLKAQQEAKKILEDEQMAALAEQMEAVKSEMAMIENEYKPKLNELERLYSTLYLKMELRRLDITKIEKPKDLLIK